MTRNCDILDAAGSGNPLCRRIRESHHGNLGKLILELFFWNIDTWKSLKSFSKKLSQPFWDFFRDAFHLDEAEIIELISFKIEETYRVKCLTRRNHVFILFWRASSFLKESQTGSHVYQDGLSGIDSRQKEGYSTKNPDIHSKLDFSPTKDHFVRVLQQTFVPKILSFNWTE